MIIHSNEIQLGYHDGSPINKAYFGVTKERVWYTLQIPFGGDIYYGIRFNSVKYAFQYWQDIEHQTKISYKTVSDGCVYTFRTDTEYGGARPTYIILTNDDTGEEVQRWLINEEIPHQELDIEVLLDNKGAINLSKGSEIWNFLGPYELYIDSPYNTGKVVYQRLY